MHYYALHIKTGSEEKIRELINKEFPGKIKVFCPLRELVIRKKGKTSKQSKPLFAGYIFIEAEEITAEILSNLKKIPGFFQVLPSNKNIKPVAQQDMQFLNSLFSKNHSLGISILLNVICDLSGKLRKDNKIIEYLYHDRSEETGPTIKIK